jgi:hypothetical protein
MNEINFEVWEAKRLMGVKAHHDAFTPANSLEWGSVVASMR